MRALLVLVVALTFCLEGVYPRIVESKLRKEFGKGLSAEQKEQPSARIKDETERDDEDEHRDIGDEPKPEGRVKETSVRKKQFMDQYYLQSGPVKYEYGHTHEDPDDWEQRYEKRDYEKNRHQGQVKWGDANGGQGEQLWDFNHGGKDSGEDEKEPQQEIKKEHRFQKPRKRIQIKEKIVEKTTDGDGSKEFSRSKTGTTVYSGHEKEEGNFKEVVTKKNKNNDPFDFDSMRFDTLETPRGFSKLDFIFDDHHHSHEMDFDHHDFDIDRMGMLAPDMKSSISPLYLPVAQPFAKKATVDGAVETSTNATDFGTQLKAGNGQANRREDRQRKFSVEEHQEIRRYDFSPSSQLKRSLENESPLSDIESVKDMVATGTKGTDMMKRRMDPVTGSLTDKSTGRVFKIFGVLVGS